MLIITKILYKMNQYDLDEFHPQIKIDHRHSEPNHEVHQISKYY
jgi:hypothetical protein